MPRLVPIVLAVFGARSALALALAAGAPPPQTALPADLPFRTAVASGDFIYLAGRISTDDHDQFVGGDIRAQTTRVLENLRKTLEEAGGRMEQVASVQVYLRRADDFQAMNEVYRARWPDRPPARTTVVAGLVLPDALVEMSLVGIRRGAERTVIHPSGWNTSPNPYSYAIKSGGTLFMSGLLARNPQDNSPIAGDITVQTKAVLENAGVILRAAGMTSADVVSARVYLTDAAAFQDMNAAYRPFFPQDPPARATVQAALTSAPYLIEIALTAVKSTDRSAVTTPNADGTPGRPSPMLSSAIRIGNRLYLSGMLGNSEAARGDADAQTREALARIGRTLEAAGFGWKHLVDGVVFLPDMQHFAAMNDAYRSIVAQPFPARATVGTGLMAADGLVEIMFVATK